MNPIDYIEKCTLDDLLQYRRETTFLNKDKKVTNATRISDLIYIAKTFLPYSDVEIAEKFNKAHGKRSNSILSSITFIKNKGITYMDRVDDLMREIAYWKFKQLQEYPLTPGECYHE